MPAMVTALTEFQDSGNSRTYVTSGHAVTKPKLFLTKRKQATGAQVVAESSGAVVHGTEDANGDSLKERIQLSAISRIPIHGIAADVDAAIVIFRDFVASDEFVTFVKQQMWPA